MAKGYLDPDWPNPNGPGDASIIIYGYTPSKELAILGISLFPILLAALAIRVTQSRLWTYIPILVACTLEIMGYSFRYLSAHADPYKIAYFVVQYFCITVAPVFIAASIYVYFSSLTASISAQGFKTGIAGRLGRRTILWTFITADVVCTVLQVTGASLIGSKTSKHQDPTTASWILVAGLAAQTLAFSIFLILLSHLIVAIAQAQRNHSNRRSLGKKRCTIALFFAGLLVMLRTVFRLAESAQGVFGYLSSQEVFFGTLEFAPVVSALVILVLWTPPTVNGAPSMKEPIIGGDSVC